jgi:hypothetical protein
VVLVGCATFSALESVVAGSPQLGTAVQLLNLPPEAQVCPNNPLLNPLP